jgi:hypothetical protein
MDRLNRMLQAAQMGGGVGGPAQVSSHSPTYTIHHLANR